MMSFPNITAITLSVKQLNFCSNQEKNIVSKYQNSVVTNHARGEMIDHAASHVFVRDFDPVIYDEPTLVADTTRAPPRLSIFWWLEENYQTAKELAEESIRAKTNPVGDAFGRWGMTLVSCIHLPIQMHPGS